MKKNNTKKHISWLKNNYIIVLISLVVLFVSLFPRIIEVMNKNYIFGFDQGRDYLAVRNIVIDRKMTLIGPEVGAGSAGINGIFHGPLYYYTLAIPFILFRGDPYGGIVTMFVFGMMTILFSFYFGKKLFNIYGGLILSFLVAISPPIISQSRLVWNTHPTSIFILFVFFCVYQIRKHNMYIFLASFFSAFIYNYQLAIAVPLCICLVVYCILIEKINKLKEVVLLGLGMVLGFLPMILFEIRHGLITAGIMRYFNQPETTSSFIQMNTLLDHGNTFLVNFFDTFPKTFFPPVVFLMSFLFIFIFYFRNENSKRFKNFISYLLLLIPSAFLVFSFFRNSIYTYYLMELTFVYILLFVYVLFTSFKNNRFIFYYLVLIMTFFTITALKTAIMVSLYDYSDFGGNAKIKGKTQTIDYIYNEAKGERFGLLIFTPPVYTYAYDYLLKWYAYNKYGYVPHTEKKGTFFLLIEKDNAKPWSHEGWLETVIKTGKVISTKTLSNGNIIQKRYE